ncbi:MAG: YdeI/OmpD-associated family protein [Methylobacterium sp.]
MPEEKAGLPILVFASLADWEAWLATAPRITPGLWLKIAKKGSGIASVTRPEAIAGALCHGWIDGQAGPCDDRHWLVRFTPRRPGSKWSQVNREAAEALIAAGRMSAAGLAEIEAARADGRWDAAYAPPSRAEVPPDLAAALDASPEARRVFDTLDRTNRYAILYHVQDAKKPETRARRIAGFVAMLERGEAPYPRKAGRTVADRDTTGEAQSRPASRGNGVDSQ